MLRLVLPKGSLERATIELFEAADLAVSRSSDVDYRASVKDHRISEVRILRPQEIPRYVADGLFDVGITGRDWVEETGAEVVSLGELSYSKATSKPIQVVLAVEAGSPWASVRDMPDGVKVSTEYPLLTERFFISNGVKADVVLSYGATEAKVPEIADAVVEITETGPCRGGRAKNHRDDTRFVHRTDSQPRGIPSPRTAQGHGGHQHVVAGCLESPGPGAGKAERGSRRPRCRRVAVAGHAEPDRLGVVWGRQLRGGDGGPEGSDKQADTGAEGCGRIRHYRVTDK